MALTFVLDTFNETFNLFWFVVIRDAKKYAGLGKGLGEDAIENVF